MNYSLMEMFGIELYHAHHLCTVKEEILKLSTSLKVQMSGKICTQVKGVSHQQPYLSKSK